VKVAALFVDPKGFYAGLPDVEVWDEERDARTYGGPWPVVAHPPCNRWAMPMAKVNQTRYGHRIGDDGGCFHGALSSVLRWGGVLEHPAATWAWKSFGLLRPMRGKWRQAATLDVLDAVVSYWVTEVSQSAFGNRARKRTWLLFSGGIPPVDIDWSDPPGTHSLSFFERSRKPRLRGKDASATPPAFRNVLLAIARSARSATRTTNSAETRREGGE